MAGTTDQTETGEQPPRRYESLTSKQQSAVDALVDGARPQETKEELAERAGVSTAYLYHCGDEFADIIDERKGNLHEQARLASDGAGATAHISCNFTEDEAFRAVRILPADLSRVVYEAIRHTESLSGQSSTGLDRLFEDEDE